MQDPGSSAVFHQQLNRPPPPQHQQQPPGVGGGVGPMGMLQFPEQEQLKCPRCESSNTKFCYYNNYNLSQPRHYCKSCRRYWTKGGALRNIPVGGGSRKNPSSSSASSSSSSSSSSKRSSSNQPASNTNDASSPSRSKRGNPDQTPDLARPARRAATDTVPPGTDQDPTRVPAPESGFSFSSLMSLGGQFGPVCDGPGQLGVDLGRVPGGGLVEDLNSGLGLGPNFRAEDGGDGGGGREEEGYLQSGEWRWLA